MLIGKDWAKISLFCQYELKDFLESLSDEEVELAMRIAIEAEKKYSDRSVNEVNHNTGTNIRR